MKELLVHLRAMQMYAQSAHHLVARTPFHSDHEFFGGVYEQLNGDYDSVAERIVGTSGEEQLNLAEISMQVAQSLQNIKSVGVKENKEFYSLLLQMEHGLCVLVDRICKSEGTSEGTKQLVGEICNQSEIRQYKIKQRIK